MKGSFRKYLTLIVLGAAGGAIYTLPYIKYVFYDAITNVLGISNAQSGFLLSMYAIGCVILYIPEESCQIRCLRKRRSSCPF